MTRFEDDDPLDASLILSRALAGAPQSLTQYPQTTATMISLPLIPSEDNHFDERQWLHLRVKRTLYFFRGDYTVEGFLSTSPDPFDPAGEPVDAKELSLQVWVDDPIGFTSQQTEHFATTCKFQKTYSGRTDFCTRHRMVAKLSVRMPKGWTPEYMETDEIAIG